MPVGAYYRARSEVGFVFAPLAIDTNSRRVASVRHLAVDFRLFRSRQYPSFPCECHGSEQQDRQSIT